MSDWQPVEGSMPLDNAMAVCSYQVVRATRMTIAGVDPVIAVTWEGNPHTPTGAIDTSCTVVATTIMPRDDVAAFCAQLTEAAERT